MMKLSHLWALSALAIPLSAMVLTVTDDAKAQTTVTPGVNLTAPVLTATGSPGVVTLTFTDSSVGQTGYIVERKVGSFGFAEIFRGSDPNQRSFVDAPGLAATYQYRVRAYTTGVKGPLSNTATAKITPGTITQGPSSSAKPYVVPALSSLGTTSLLTVGDSVAGKSGAPYRMVGIPDGLGAYDNGNGTFTVLMNHELGAAVGVVREHGAIGAFVSKFTIRKSDLRVLRGEDLIKQVALWNPLTSMYEAPVKGVVFNRFCSADLAPASSTGSAGRLYMTGEEAGAEGRAFATTLDGTAYELPRLGNLSYENILLNPSTGEKTVAMETDDTRPGQVYVYVGTKTNAGSPVDRAGLTNGVLYGVKVNGIPIEDIPTGIATGTKFELAPFGNVENKTGADLQADSVAAGVTEWQRPEDGAWDPSSPNDFYFNTTSSFTTPSRLYRLRFNDRTQPELGGTVSMMLDGSEGQKMLDNMTINKHGQIYLQEDPGGNAHIAKVWRYDIGSDSLTLIALHNPGLFAPNANVFPFPDPANPDEESSGIVDVSEILGDGKYLFDVQAHYPNGLELVEGGQLLLLNEQRAFDLAISSTATPSPFMLPSSSDNLLTLDITVRNTGSEAATNVEVRSFIPGTPELLVGIEPEDASQSSRFVGNSVIISLDTLKPGETRTLRLKFAPQSSGSLKFVSRASATGTDANTLDNSTTTFATVK